MKIKSIEEFKRIVTPLLDGVSVGYRHFDESDFGMQDEIYFEIYDHGVQINFWDSGWLELCICDMNNGTFYLNRLLGPDETLEQQSVWRVFFDFLKNKGNETAIKVHWV